MKTRLPINAKISAEVLRAAALNPRIPIGTLWTFDHIRGGRIIESWEQGNVTTDEGLNALLDIMFHGSTQIATWYIALFEDNYSPASGDTYAVPGYTESTAYTEGARQAFVEAAASAKSISNVASKATFTMNATKTIYGASLVGGGSAPTDNTDTAGGGTLFCSSKFSTSKSVVNTDILQVSCTITLADV